MAVGRYIPNASLDQAKAFVKRYSQAFLLLVHGSRHRALTARRTRTSFESTVIDFENSWIVPGPPILRRFARSAATSFAAHAIRTNRNDERSSPNSGAGSRPRDDDHSRCFVSHGRIRVEGTLRSPTVYGTSMPTHIGSRRTRLLGSPRGPRRTRSSGTVACDASNAGVASGQPDGPVRVGLFGV